MKYASFATKDRNEALLINKIAHRAVALATSAGFSYKIMDADMDITACHVNGNPLKLEELAQANDGDFGHDVFGIRKHIDRTTGELQNCFCPRYSA